MKTDRETEAKANRNHRCMRGFLNMCHNDCIRIFIHNSKRGATPLGFFSRSGFCISLRLHRCTVWICLLVCPDDILNQGVSNDVLVAEINEFDPLHLLEYITYLY